MKAIYDKDLEQVLANLGVLDKIIAGEINCAVCGCQVDLDNLGSVFPEGDEIKVTCDNDRCVRTITTRAAGALSG